MIKIVTSKSPVLTAFNARPAFPEEAEKAASAVLADIRKNGEKAVLKAVAKFEGFKAKRARDLMVDLESIRVDKGTVRVGKGAVGGNRPCETLIDPKIIRAVKDAHKRVLRFSKASLR